MVSSRVEPGTTSPATDATSTPVGANTRVDLTEVQQRPHRESRANQQRNRECDLHHYQLPAQSG